MEMGMELGCSETVDDHLLFNCAFTLIEVILVFGLSYSILFFSILSLACHIIVVLAMQFWPCFLVATFILKSRLV